MKAIAIGGIIFLFALLLAGAAPYLPNRRSAWRTGGGTPTPDLVHWPLNDAAGTTIVAAVGSGTTGSTGTLNGDYLAMAAGNGYFTSTSTITWGSATVTVAFWVRKSDFSADYGEILKSTDVGGTPRFHVYFGFNLIGAVVYGDTGERREYVAAPFAANTWTHVAFVLSNADATGDVKVYIDGSEVGSPTLETNTKTGTGSFTTDKLSIKNIFSDGAQFDLDDLRIYAGELSGAQIGAIYTGGRP
jgi:hypothetical protein